jgi:endonuclease/exonuclease/phosphatase family metal-dependent hydrolase
MRSITVLSGNLMAGGIGRSRQETRFKHLMAAAAQQCADVVCFQECLYWHEDDNRLLHRAEDALGMRGLLCVTPTGMDVAVFVRKPLHVVASRHITGGVWRHGAIRAVVVWPADGDLPSGQMTIGSVHLSARSPAQRMLEVEQITTWFDADELTAVLGDYNVPDAHTDLAGADPRVLAALALLGSTEPDVRPIQRMIDAGFLDLASRGGVRPEPTTGHWPGKNLVNRPDRMMVSPPLAKLIDTVETVHDVADFTDHLWQRFCVHLDCQSKSDDESLT